MVVYGDMYRLRLPPRTPALVPLDDERNRGGDGGGDGDYATATAKAATWERVETIGDLPLPRAHHSSHMVVEGASGDGVDASGGAGKLVVFGGRDGSGTVCFVDLHVLDVDTMRWSAVALPVDYDRYVAHVRKMTTDGSRPIPGSVPCPVHVNVQRGKPLPPPHDGTATASVGGASVGGAAAATSDADKGLWFLPRVAHASCVFGNYLFVVCGHDGNRYVNDVAILNLGTSRARAGLLSHLIAS